MEWRLRRSQPSLSKGLIVWTGRSGTKQEGQQPPFSKQSAEDQIKMYLAPSPNMMVSSQDLFTLKASDCLTDSLFLTTKGCHL